MGEWLLAIILTIIIAFVLAVLPMRESCVLSVIIFLIIVIYKLASLIL
jgi:hypothetical protein